MKAFFLFLGLILGIQPALGSEAHNTDASIVPVAWEEVPINATKQVDPKNYNAGKLILSQTTFYLLTRKQNGIEAERFARAIHLAWPKWRQLFKFNIPVVSIIDYDQFLGGGAFSGFVLGIYLGGDAPQLVNDFLKLALEWDPQPTCRKYIETYYNKFDDPVQAYVNDLVTHELGHLIFGYGLTLAPEDLDAWFALGLGIVYDRMIWNSFEHQESPIISSLVSIWRKKYAHRADIDQRLVSPDTSNDNNLGLIRLQTYAHGKAYAYLSELRKRLGPARFDRLVQAYISRPQGSKIEYDDFLSYLTPVELRIVKMLESEFVVR